MEVQKGIRWMPFLLRFSSSARRPTRDSRTRCRGGLRRDHDNAIRRIGTVLPERGVSLDHLNLRDLVAGQRWHLITPEPNTVDDEEKRHLGNAGRGCGFNGASRYSLG